MSDSNELVEIESNSAVPSSGGRSARAQFEMQHEIAMRYPRSAAKVRTALFELVTIDEASAQESIYALPRAGKPVTGPSIRFAEAVKQAWGNCTASAEVVETNREEKYVEAEGVFHDMQTNTITKFRHRRRISGRSGKIFSDDMILVTSNAACSIAMREAILKGIPKSIWRAAHEEVMRILSGDVITLNENREKAIKAFAIYGVKPDQIFAALGVAGELDITLDHIVVMRGMFAAIKNGEETVESVFSKPETSNANPNSNPLVKTAHDPATGEIKDSTATGGGNEVETSDDVGHQPKTGVTTEDRSAGATQETGKADANSATKSDAGQAGATGASEPDLLSSTSGGRTPVDDKAGAAKAASASSALQAYAKRVLEFAGSPRELNAAATKFWNDNGGRPTDEPTKKILEAIYGDKLRALNKEITAEELKLRLQHHVGEWT